jgi:hypothetical protein
MSPQEMEAILKSILSAETEQLDAPSDADWQRLESKFSCRFGADFKTFIGMMSHFQFPGDILNVSTGRTNGNDAIATCFDFELAESDWSPDMIPFYSIGNGDYFCLKRTECPESRIYYFYSERPAFDYYCDSFEEWVRQLPDFLK